MKVSASGQILMIFQFRELKNTTIYHFAFIIYHYFKFRFGEMRASRPTTNSRRSGNPERRLLLLLANDFL